MKALKDIGRTMMSFAESLANTDNGLRPGFMVGTVAEMSKPSGSICRVDSPKIRVHVYTDAERRKLVRAVWKAALQSVMRIDDPYDDASRCEEFLKSEGL